MYRLRLSLIQLKSSRLVNVRVLAKASTLTTTTRRYKESVMNKQIEKAIESLELQEERYQSHAYVLTEEEHCDIFKVVKRPKVFPKVEYSKCVTIIDNR